MGQSRSVMLVLTLAALYGTTAGCAWKRQAQQKREDAYQLALRSYSEPSNQE